MQKDPLLQKSKKLPPKQQLLFSIINQGPAFKKKLVSRTKLDTNQITRLLTQLSQLRLIKSIKQAQSKTLNIWVRYDFVEQTKVVINTDTIEFLAKSEGDLDEIKKEMERKGYSVKGFKDIVRVLVNSGEIYQEGNRIWKRNMGLLVNPCVGCKLFELCIPKGPISPQNCTYYEKW